MGVGGGGGGEERIVQTKKGETMILWKMREGETVMVIL